MAGSFFWITILSVAGLEIWQVQGNDSPLPCLYTLRK